MDELVDTTQTSEVSKTSEVLNGFKEIKIGPHLSSGGYAATPSPLPNLGEERGPGGEERAFKETETSLSRWSRRFLK